jgi:hypothetical protein
MNYTAAQRFMTDTQLAESISKQFTNTPTPNNDAKSNGISIGQAVTIGLTIAFVTWQLWERHKTLDKALNTDTVEHK